MLSHRKKPEFCLQRVYSDGSQDEPQIFQLADLEGGWQMGRRAFLVTGGISVAALLSIQACSRGEEPDDLRITPGGEQAKGSSIFLSNQCDPAIKAHDQPIKALAFSPDGKLLASSAGPAKPQSSSGATGVNAIKLWEMPSNNLFKTLKTHAAPVVSLAFSADGRFLASASLDKTVVVWDVSYGTVFKTLKGHTDAVLSVAFSPDGKYLATGSLDKSIKLWELPSGELKDTFVHKPGLIYMFTKGHKAEVNTLRFSPDGRLLASASSDGAIMIWEMPSGRREATLEAGPITCLAFSLDGRFLFSGAKNGDFRVWRMSSLKAPTLLTSTLQSVQCIASFGMDDPTDPKSTSTGSATADGTVRLWRIPPGELRKAISCGDSNPGAANSAIAFAADGSLLAVGSSDGCVRIWDLRTDRFVTCLFDPGTLRADRKVNRYTYTNQYGQKTTATLPCGSPTPPGAICTCDCVPGSISLPTTGVSTGQICTCDQICTCVPIK